MHAQLKKMLQLGAYDNYASSIPEAALISWKTENLQYFQARKAIRNGDAS